MPQNANGQVAQNPVNNPDVNRVRTRSRFPLVHDVGGTFRFGEYAPHFVYDGVSDDKRVLLNSSHNVRSYTLKSPLLSKIRLNKDYILVYMDAILPRQWDRILTNPTVGQDVNALECNTTVDAFEVQLRSLVNILAQWCDAGELPDSQKLERVLKAFFILENFFSAGSLLSAMGCNFDTLYSSAAGDTFDDVFDKFFSLFPQRLESFDVLGSGELTTPLKVVCGDFLPSAANRALSLRQFIDFARSSFGWTITNVTLKQGKQVPTRTFQASSVRVIANAQPFNYARCLAYQLACAQYFTNDRIDYIYDAELYRQSIWSIFVDSGLILDTDTTFDWNGIKLEYDILSGHFVGAFIRKYTSGQFTDWNYFGEFVNSVFSFRRSLRFVDYFTGARPFPLAVGDSNIQVTPQGVNVIDVVQKTMLARFRNAVMRSGRRLGNYVDEILGGHSRPDYHQPFWIGRTSDSITSVETENTGTLQYELANSTTSVLRSASSRFGFELDVDRPCIIVGVTSFDIPRYYTRGVDKFFRKVDRFEMFNPFMQFIGDQPILRSERDAAVSLGDSVFGYQQRYMEYKQMISRAFGGLKKALPGWVFLADESRIGNNDVVVNPDFIRSSPSELDKFFVSLSGYSLSTYFHFIIEFNNNLEASRPMAWSPQLM